MTKSKVSLLSHLYVSFENNLKAKEKITSSNFSGNRFIWISGENKQDNIYAIKKWGNPVKKGNFN